MADKHTTLPTVGRTVHFVHPRALSLCMPATVTHVEAGDPSVVHLTVFPPPEIAGREKAAVLIGEFVQYRDFDGRTAGDVCSASGGRSGHSWHWPVLS